MSLKHDILYLKYADNDIANDDLSSRFLANIIWFMQIVCILFISAAECATRIMTKIPE